MAVISEVMAPGKTPSSKLSVGCVLKKPKVWDLKLCAKEAESLGPLAVSLKKPKALGGKKKKIIGSLT
jgi:hypothetical protein